MLRRITGRRNINQSGDGILISLIGTVLLNILQMLLIGTVKTIGCLVTYITDTRLAATDIDEQVHIVARRVTLQGFQLFSCRLCHLQRTFKIMTHHEQVGQTAGSLGIGVIVFFRCSRIQRGSPVEFCHTELSCPVTGISTPVVGLCRREFTPGLQTVGQSDKTMIVPRPIGCFHLFLSLFVLCLLVHITTRHYQRHHQQGHEPLRNLFHIVYHSVNTNIWGKDSKKIVTRQTFPDNSCN